MSGTLSFKLEVDGHAPTEDDLHHLALNAYGHFTAMQVRGFRTRGLGLHLDRLGAANLELFGEPLDGERVRGLIRHALRGESGDASVRVVVVEAGGNGGAGGGNSGGSGSGSGVSVVVTVRPPYELPDTPQRLKSVPYLRTAAHLKRAGDFGQRFHDERAIRDGYDQALLTGADGLVAEGAISNIALFDGESVVWPDAPVLAGITMQLVAPRTAALGLPSRTARVTLADLPGFAGACVTNSRGIAVVAQIDDVTLPTPPEFAEVLRDAYGSAAWDEF